MNDFIPIPGEEERGRIPTATSLTTMNPSDLQRRASERASGMLSQFRQPQIAPPPDVTGGESKGGAGPSAKPNPLELLYHSIPSYLASYLTPGGMANRVADFSGNVARDLAGREGQEVSGYVGPGGSLTPKNPYLEGFREAGRTALSMNPIFGSAMRWGNRMFGGGTIPPPGSGDIYDVSSIPPVEGSQHTGRIPFPGEDVGGSPTVGRITMPDGSVREISDDYWKTPFPAGSQGGFSVGGGAPMGEMNIGGKTYTLPMSDFPLPSLGARSYYDAHPEEKAAQDMYDMIRPPGVNSYEAGKERMREMNLWDIVKSPNVSQEARATAKAQLGEIEKNRGVSEMAARELSGKTYGNVLQYGSGSPQSQERLAHADYLRTMPLIGERNAATAERRAAAIEDRPIVAPWGVVDPRTGEPIYMAPETKTSPHQRLFQDLIDRSTEADPNDPMGNKTFNEEAFNNRLRVAIKYGMLPKEWKGMLPAPTPKAPTWPQFITEMKERGSKMSENDLKKYYQENYGQVR